MKFDITSPWAMFIKSFFIQFSSVAESCLILCDPIIHSTPGFPVHHHLPEFTQTHVHEVGDAIQTIFFLKHLKICPVYFLRQNSRPTNARVTGMILVRSGEESMQACDEGKESAFTTSPFCEGT